MSLNSLATTRSCLPSLLKSPTATELGLSPTIKLVAAPNVPLPFPNSIETLSLAKFVTARSCFPSPLKSPTATDSGPTPTVKFVAGPNVPSPLPNSIDTLLLP